MCRRCTDKECQDIGTQNEPIEIECHLCGGIGCDKCDSGFIKIEGCPNVYCQGIIPVIRMIELFEKGLPPVVGGTLDQAVWFLEAASLFKREESIIEAERYKRG